MLPLQVESTLTCPACHASHREVMLLDACRWFYECAACHALLTPIAGDCCVFCSFGDVPCPPIQRGHACCHGPRAVGDDLPASVAG